MVSLPLADGLKYANSANVVYSITGTGVDFTLIPSRRESDNGLVFCISVHDKDSREFESDCRFDAIRHWFQASPVTSIHNKDNKSSKKRLLHYSTPQLSSEDTAFVEIMTLLASLRATIMIPRQYLTVGEMKGYTCSSQADENSNWPKLNWRESMLLPPVRKELQIRITAPVDRNAGVNLVDEYSPEILLCRRTLPMQGLSLSDSAVRGQFTSLYFDWQQYRRDYGHMPSGDPIDESVRSISLNILNDIHRMLANSAKSPVIKFDELLYARMQELVNSVALSDIGKIRARYRDEMLFMAPPKEVVSDFLDSCPYDWRLDSIRQSLENYIKGKTEIILDK